MIVGVERVGWRAAQLVVVDLETTGLDPRVDEVISFAAIPVREGRVRPAELVSTLVRPRHPPPAEGIRIHGLRESDLREEPTLGERIELIAAALAGSVLVAHCAWIETRFLGEALAEHGRSLEGPVIDTMALGGAVLARRGIACPESPSLDFLARALGLPVHRPHHADGDALTTAQVFIALASLFDREREPTIGELARARPPRISTRDRLSRRLRR
ncbi:MAG TPA: 3'-5' exonuclease [Solirubrobacteraceae bacterium]|nr:3'-5' exonuclease [Solirubrobacteraceae bacterium]